MSKSKRLDRFILNYQGNKYRESKKYLFDLDISKYEVIFEPYGGIFGFSRCMFELNPDYKGKFIINDINKDLINFFKKLKTNIEKTCKTIKNKIDKIWKDCDNKDANFTNKLRALDDYSIKLLCRGMNNNLFMYKKGVKKISNFLEKKEEYKKFFDKITFWNLKSSDAFDKINKIDKKILIFHDPPYFNSSNTSYFNEPISIGNKLISHPDATALYIHILNQFEKKHDNILIINFTAVIHYIFKDYEKKQFEVIYQNSSKKKNKEYQKTKSVHVIYSNI